MKIYRLKERLLLIFLIIALSVAVFTEASIEALTFAWIVCMAAVTVYLWRMK